MKRRYIILWVVYFCILVAMFGFQEKQDAYEQLVPYYHTGRMDEATQATDSSETETASPASKAESTYTQISTESLETIELTEPSDPTEPTEEIHYPLDLNTVTFEALCLIPDIGEVTAQAICDYRAQHGGFRYMEELLEIHGIGDKRFQRLAAYLFLPNESPAPKSQIPATEAPQPEPQEAPPETEAETIPILNLNSVTKEQLMLLPGCDEILAESILYLRDELIHIFYNPLEITLIEGVTEELFLLWRPYLAVDDEGGTQLPRD